MSVPVIAFDIETIPDAVGLRTVYGMSADVADSDVVEIALQERRRNAGTDFLQPYLHRVIAISCALFDRDGLKVWSLGDESSSEKALITRFFDGINRLTPQLVSWNGSGFDLPVLVQRGFLNGVSAPKFWDQGEDDRDFKWNNYIGRYHGRHLDLMDVLALYQGRALAPLDNMARMAGFPGKLGMDGSAVYGAYQAGRLSEIRAYCETDAMNTLLLWLRFELHRGLLTEEAYEKELSRWQTTLKSWPQKHWQDFMAAWPEPR
jgi:predicted PolB exonuclease-like 3'-5' exonuclease